MAKFSELDIELQEKAQLDCGEVWEQEYLDYLEKMCEYYNWYEFMEGY